MKIQYTSRYRDSQADRWKHWNTYTHAHTIRTICIEKASCAVKLDRFGAHWLLLTACMENQMTDKAWHTALFASICLHERRRYRPTNGQTDRTFPAPGKIAETKELERENITKKWGDGKQEGKDRMQWVKAKERSCSEFAYWKDCDELESSGFIWSALRRTSRVYTETAVCAQPWKLTEIQTDGTTEWNGFLVRGHRNLDTRKLNAAKFWFFFFAFEIYIYF